MLSSIALALVLMCFAAAPVIADDVIVPGPCDRRTFRADATTERVIIAGGNDCTFDLCVGSGNATWAPLEFRLSGPLTNSRIVICGAALSNVTLDLAPNAVSRNDGLHVSLRNVSVWAAQTNITVGSRSTVTIEDSSLGTVNILGASMAMDVGKITATRTSFMSETYSSGLNLFELEANTVAEVAATHCTFDWRGHMVVPGTAGGVSLPARVNGVGRVVFDHNNITFRHPMTANARNSTMAALLWKGRTLFRAGSPFFPALRQLAGSLSATHNVGTVAVGSKSASSFIGLDMVNVTASSITASTMINVSDNRFTRLPMYRLSTSKVVTLVLGPPLLPVSSLASYVTSMAGNVSLFVHGNFMDWTRVVRNDLGELTEIHFTRRTLDSVPPAGMPADANTSLFVSVEDNTVLGALRFANPRETHQHNSFTRIIGALSMFTRGVAVHFSRNVYRHMPMSGTTLNILFIDANEGRMLPSGALSLVAEDNLLDAPKWVAIAFVLQSTGFSDVFIQDIRVARNKNFFNASAEEIGGILFTLDVAGYNRHNVTYHVSGNVNVTENELPAALTVLGIRSPTKLHGTLEVSHMRGVRANPCYSEVFGQCIRYSTLISLGWSAAPSLFAPVEVNHLIVRNISAAANGSAATFLRTTQQLSGIDGATSSITISDVHYTAVGVGDVFGLMLHGGLRHMSRILIERTTFELNLSSEATPYAGRHGATDRACAIFIDGGTSPGLTIDIADSTFITWNDTNVPTRPVIEIDSNATGSLYNEQLHLVLERFTTSNYVPMNVTLGHRSSVVLSHTHTGAVNLHGSGSETLDIERVVASSASFAIDEEGSGFGMLDLNASTIGNVSVVDSRFQWRTNMRVRGSAAAVALPTYVDAIGEVTFDRNAVDLINPGPKSTARGACVAGVFWRGRTDFYDNDAHVLSLHQLVRGLFVRNNTVRLVTAEYSGTMAVSADFVNVTIGAIGPGFALDFTGNQYTRMADNRQAYVTYLHTSIGPVLRPPIALASYAASPDDAAPISLRMVHNVFNWTHAATNEYFSGWFLQFRNRTLPGVIVPAEVVPVAEPGPVLVQKTDNDWLPHSFGNGMWVRVMDITGNLITRRGTLVDVHRNVFHESPEQGYYSLAMMRYHASAESDSRRRMTVNMTRNAMLNVGSHGTFCQNTMQHRYATSFFDSIHIADNVGPRDFPAIVPRFTPGMYLMSFGAYFLVDVLGNMTMTRNEVYHGLTYANVACNLTVRGTIEISNGAPFLTLREFTIPDFPTAYTVSFLVLGYELDSQRTAVISFGHLVVANFSSVTANGTETALINAKRATLRGLYPGSTFTVRDVELSGNGVGDSLGVAFGKPVSGLEQLRLERVAVNTTLDRVPRHSAGRKSDAEDQTCSLCFTSTVDVERISVEDCVFSARAPQQRRVSLVEFQSNVSVARIDIVNTLDHTSRRASSSTSSVWHVFEGKARTCHGIAFTTESALRPRSGHSRVAVNITNVQMELRVTGTTTTGIFLNGLADRADIGITGVSLALNDSASFISGINLLPPVTGNTTLTIADTNISLPHTTGFAAGVIVGRFTETPLGSTLARLVLERTAITVGYSYDAGPSTKCDFCSGLWLAFMPVADVLVSDVSVTLGQCTSGACGAVLDLSALRQVRRSLTVINTRLSAVSPQGGDVALVQVPGLLRMFANLAYPPTTSPASPIDLLTAVPRRSLHVENCTLQPVATDTPGSRVPAAFHGLVVIQQLHYADGGLWDIFIHGNVARATGAGVHLQDCGFHSVQITNNRVEFALGSSTLQTGARHSVGRLAYFGRTSPESVPAVVNSNPVCNAPLFGVPPPTGASHSESPMIRIQHNEAAAYNSAAQSHDFFIATLSATALLIMPPSSAENEPVLDISSNTLGDVTTTSTAAPCPDVGGESSWPPWETSLVELGFYNVDGNGPPRINTSTLTLEGINGQQHAHRVIRVANNTVCAVERAVVQIPLSGARPIAASIASVDAVMLSNASIYTEAPKWAPTAATALNVADNVVHRVYDAAGSTTSPGGGMPVNIVTLGGTLGAANATRVQELRGAWRATVINASRNRIALQQRPRPGTLALAHFNAPFATSEWPMMPSPASESPDPILVDPSVTSLRFERNSLLMDTAPGTGVLSAFLSTTIAAYDGLDNNIQQVPSVALRSSCDRIATASSSGQFTTSPHARVLPSLEASHSRVVVERCSETVSESAASPSLSDSDRSETHSGPSPSISEPSPSISTSETFPLPKFLDGVVTAFEAAAPFPPPVPAPLPQARAADWRRWLSGSLSPDVVVPASVLADRIRATTDRPGNRLAQAWLQVVALNRSAAPGADNLDVMRQWDPNATASAPRDAAEVRCIATLEPSEEEPIIQPTARRATPGVARRRREQVEYIRSLFEGMVVNVSIVAADIALLHVMPPPVNNLTVLVDHGAGAASFTVHVRSLTRGCFTALVPLPEDDPSLVAATHFTVTMPPGEPLPEDAVSTTTIAVTTAAGTASAFAGSSTSASIMARTMIVGDAADCGQEMQGSEEQEGDLEEEDEVQPIVSSPLQLNFEFAGGASYLLGMAIGNTVLTLGIGVAGTLFAAGYAFVRDIDLLPPDPAAGDPSAPFWARNTMLRRFVLLMNYARQPSVVAFPCAFLFEPTLGGALGTLLHPDTSVLARLIGLLILLLVVASLAALVRLLFQQQRDSAIFEWRDGITRSAAWRRLPPMPTSVKEVFVPLGEWRDAVRRPSGAAKNAYPSFSRMGFLFFADFNDRLPWFFLVDLLLAFLLACASVYSDAYGGCVGSNVIVLGVLSVYLVAMCRLMPYESFFQLGFAVLVTALQVVASLLSLVHSVTHSRSLHHAISGLLAATAFLVLVRTVYDVARVVYHAVRYRISHQLAKTDSTGAATGSGALGALLWSADDDDAHEKEMAPLQLIATGDGHDGGGADDGHQGTPRGADAPRPQQDPAEAVLDDHNGAMAGDASWSSGDAPPSSDSSPLHTERQAMLEDEYATIRELHARMARANARLRALRSASTTLLDEGEPPSAAAQSRQDEGARSGSRRRRSGANVDTSPKPPPRALSSSRGGAASTGVGEVGAPRERREGVSSQRDGSSSSGGDSSARRTRPPDLSARSRRQLEAARRMAAELVPMTGRTAKGVTSATATGTPPTSRRPAAVHREGVLGDHHGVERNPYRRADTLRRAASAPRTASTKLRPRDTADL